MNVGSDFELPAASLYRKQPEWTEPFVGPQSDQTPLLTDSGRSAIRLALRFLQLPPGTEVLLPAYNCDSVIQAVQAEGCTPVFYPVSPTLEVEEDAVQPLMGPQVGVLLSLGYFGLGISEGLVRLAARQGIPLMVDLSHSLLSPAVVDRVKQIPGVLVVASLRKLWPIPDGGLLYAPGRELPSPDRTGTARHADTRMGAMAWKAAALETWAEGDGRLFRSSFLEAEEELDIQDGVHSISRTSLRLLQSLSVFELQRRRLANYNLLLSHSTEWTRMVSPLLGQLPDGVTPLGLPVICASAGARDALRSYLVQRGIFPPIHWPTQESSLHVFTEAALLRQRMLTLPCDHRYDPVVMTEVARHVADWSKQYVDRND